MILHLVTRPTVDCEPLVSDLRSMGRTVLCDPVIEIEFYPGKDIDFTGVQAFVITSANGVRALKQYPVPFDTPVYCVGDASATEARKSGFEKVFSAQGDVTNLATLICKQLNPGNGVLFHPAASELAGDLKGELERSGFCYRREILYYAAASKVFFPATINQLKTNNINEISFFSPRSSRIFSQLVATSGLNVTLAGCRIFCLSYAVSESLRVFDQAKIYTASEPTGDAMKQLIMKNT
ncbi:uroporphyrinogen-III synthase [Kiloniella laminariae]|uniref:Uroporphyrinogen-III synthase n=1 Tax=Kiloniella laminariae TaxID=454162 RepID=A0ABT4LIZ5_9PROT|nr:uroporphyrinogen-III synthase [Kiloniella laminariae]MCZ4281080.1 uroporphyrinogen-III synthase [Kiloniella laminariae]